MNEVSNVQRKPNVSPPSRNHATPPQSDVDDFDRSLRSLEESQPNNTPTGHPLTPNQAPLLTMLSGSDNSALSDTTIEQTVGVGLTESEEQTTPFNMQDEPLTSQDRDALDAVLDTALPQWLSPPSLAGSELPLNESGLMTLHDFTSLLEQGWTPKSPNGTQVWGFTLHDTAFPLTRIVLKNERAANGYWSVSLSVNGENNVELSQHLQQLRTRLEKLGNNISHVVLAEEG